MSGCRVQKDKLEQKQQQNEKQVDKGQNLILSAVIWYTWSNRLKIAINQKLPKSPDISAN